MNTQLFRALLKVLNTLLSDDDGDPDALKTVDGSAGGFYYVLRAGTDSTAVLFS